MNMTEHKNESQMTTEYEKMRSQQLYCFDDAEVMASIVRANELCTKLSIMTLASPEYRQTVEALIPGIPQSSVIIPPFHCDHGHGITVGEHTFINCDCIMLDGGEIKL